MLNTIEAERFRELTPWPQLIAALEQAFREPCETPRRHHHEIHVPGNSPGTLLMMPAWRSGQVLGIKLVHAFPGNAKFGMPSIHGVYVLASASTGALLSLIDAEELTARRTAAASALASRFLSRPDSANLLVMGTGRLALGMAAAHAAVRPIRRVAFWGRSPAKAAALALRARRELRVDAVAATSLADEVANADIVTTVTTASEPVLRGRWLRTGTHVDLVGAFTPQMREADDDVIRRGRTYVDTLDTAPFEAGDLSQPIASGVLDVSTLQGDLFQLCQDKCAGRRDEREITVFKSVGLALEDLAAAELAWSAQDHELAALPAAGNT
jgi:ornithine cyclodeaminase/alanine dehydrogenase-like protein (mu-crystallin family)